jgi:PH domain/leucine-rich repeat-containing protein phosphatase
VIAFNNFSELPYVIFRLNRLQTLIASGNNISEIPETVYLLHSLQELDLRLNNVVSLPVDSLMSLSSLKLVDVQDNHLSSIEVSKLNAVELVHVNGNHLRVLGLNGGEVTHVVAQSNDIISLQMHLICYNLTVLDVSRNSLSTLPESLCDLPCLELIDASHNELTVLPPRIFWNVKKLHTLHVDHNKLTQLPERIDRCQIEVLTVQYNRLTLLPLSMLMWFHKLRHLNASTNLLMSIPSLGATDDLNNVEELYLSSNRLKESAMNIASRYRKLRVLHVAFNHLKNIPAKALSAFGQLEELNIAGNQISSLPNCFDKLPRLKSLIAHSNLLTSLPDLSCAKSLKFLDFGCNKLSQIPNPLANIGHCQYTDFSGNQDLVIDQPLITALNGVNHVLLEDVPNCAKCTHLLPKQAHYSGTQEHKRWTHGSAELQGNRPNLSGVQIKVPDFSCRHDGLYAVFDGGTSPEASSKLVQTFKLILVEEFDQQRPQSNPSDYMKYAFLSAHKLLGSCGNRSGASAAVCHIHAVKKVDGAKDGYMLTVGNVGHTEVVLCREGQVHVVTTKHTASNVNERKRIRDKNGFISEDNKVNGMSLPTRLLGCSYLSPWVIPCPSVRSIPLTPEDEFLIIACGGLWRCVSYNQAVVETRRQPNPVAAAKRLRDLARSYGSTGNISVIVVRLNLEGIAVAPLDPRYRTALSPPRKSRYRWSKIDLSTLVSGDSVSELSDAVSIARLQSSASCDWTRTRSVSASDLSSLRQTRTLPRRDRQDRLSRQAVFENDGFDEASETTVVEAITSPTNEPVEHDNMAVSDRLPFLDTKTAESVELTETDLDVDAELYHGPSTAETELTAKLQELKELQSTAKEHKQPDGVVSVAAKQYTEVKQDEDFMASSKNSSIHIPELDDLDRTLSLAGADEDDD